MCRSLSFNTSLGFAQHLVLTAMNNSRTEVDPSKKQSLIDGTPSRKRRQVDNVEELVATRKSKWRHPMGDMIRTGLSL